MSRPRAFDHLMNAGRQHGPPASQARQRWSWPPGPASLAQNKTPAAARRGGLGKAHLAGRGASPPFDLSRDYSLGPGSGDFIARAPGQRGAGQEQNEG